MNLHTLFFVPLLFLSATPLSAGLDDLVFPTHSTTTFRAIVEFVNTNKQSHERKLNPSKLENLSPQNLRGIIHKTLENREATPNNATLLGSLSETAGTVGDAEKATALEAILRRGTSLALPAIPFVERRPTSNTYSPLSPRRAAAATALSPSPVAVSTPRPSPCGDEDAIYTREPLKMSTDPAACTIKHGEEDLRAGFVFASPSPVATPQPATLDPVRKHLKDKINPAYNLTYTDTMLYLAKRVHFLDNEAKLQLPLDEFKRLLYTTVAELPESDENALLCSLLSDDSPPPKLRIKQTIIAALIDKIKEASTEEGYAGDDDSNVGE